MFHIFLEVKRSIDPAFEAGMSMVPKESREQVSLFAMRSAMVFNYSPAQQLNKLSV